MQKQDLHVSLIPGKSTHSAEMLMGRNLRNYLPELTKNSNVSVSLKEKDRGQKKNSILKDEAQWDWIYQNQVIQFEYDNQ